jgi:hypothetical protein
MAHIKLQKIYSKVNYEIENTWDKKQKRTVVHVNRLTKFNQREESPTVTNPNIQQPQEINAKSRKTEEKHTNQQTTPVRRGRGRPRKNAPHASEDQLSKPAQNHQIHNSLNPRTRNQTTQTPNQSREPRRPRSRSNMRNQATLVERDIF